MAAFIAALAVAMTIVTVQAGKPNIIMMVADDVGSADYEWADSAMRTPQLNKLKARGVYLPNHYTLQTCTPTRSTLLTGRYAHRTGMQIGKIKGTFLRYLPVEEKLMPATMQELGYETHAIGKWHLGLCHWDLTPRFRGFDTFYGFLSGAQSYFNHTDDNGAFDFRDNGRLAWETKGNYSTELHTARAVQIIKESTKKPFFMYMAYQNAHAPWEAKQEYIDEYCSHVSEPKRKVHCAMVAAMDVSIGEIVKALDETNKTEDTIIVYFSDNGGPVRYGSSNWPLRGGKAAFWEGGMKNPAIFVYPRRIKGRKQGRTLSGLMHVTDWYKTFVKAAKGKQGDLQRLDGFNQLPFLMKANEKKPSNRDRLVYNFDDARDDNLRAAVRIGDLKLHRAKPAASRDGNSWLAPPDMIAAGNATTEMVSNKDLKHMVNGYFHLYDVGVDPSERNNIIDDYANSTILQDLHDFMEAEEAMLKPFPKNMVKNPNGRPIYYSGAWSPGWCCPHSA